MVKKILLFFSFFFLFNISNVFAYQLPTAYTGVDYVDGTYQDGNTNVASWWGSNNYLASPYRLGYFTSATAEAKKIQFLWSGLNLCPNQNLKVSGKIGALFNFFTENPYQISIFNNNKEMTCSYTLEDNSRVGYTCVGTGGGNFYIALSQLSFASHNNYEVAVSRDIDYSCEVTNLQVMQQQIINTQNIINSQNQNTQDIINNQNQNNQNVIDNQNQNTQDIINNQNSNTEKEIESQKVCEIVDKNYIEIDNSLLNTAGNISSNNAFGITKYFNINKNTKIKVIYNQSFNSFLCFYDINKEKISCLNNSDLIENSYITIPSNSGYVRFTIVKSQNKPQFEICKNGNQALTDSLTSEDSPNTSNELNDLDSSTASDTPISDLITLPITLINVFINGIDSSCSPVNLGNLYGTDLIFPCINIEQTIGSDLWSTIDILFSIFMCYNIGMLFVSAFSGITSLRDDFDSLYQPKHADTGYQPKHGG